MKRIIIIILSLAVSSLAYSQSPIGKGGKQLNFGVGLYGYGVPVYVGLDFGVHPDITVGPQIGLDTEFDYISFSGRGDYHFNTILEIPRDWDFYAGLNIGFAASLNNHDHNFDKNKHNRNHDHISGLDLGLQVGGRYYWSSGWGINLEFGGGNNLSGGRLGLSKRF